LVSIPGLNDDKLAVHAYGARVATSIRLAVRRFDALVVGTSRVGAISTEHPAFADQRVFNTALMQTSMVELGRLFDYAAARQDVRTVVIGLDFVTFSTRRTLSADFSRSAFAGHSPWLLLAKTLASGQTLVLSMDTIRTSRGRRPLTTPTLAAVEELLAKFERQPRKAFDAVLRDFLTRPTTYGCYEYDSERVEILGRMLERARAEGARVDLFFSPVHARQLEMIRALGLFDTFERWKREVAGVVAREGAGAEGAPTLWDFTGYEGFTTEEIPDGEAKMEWYVESSHYREALGDIVLSRMYRPDPPERYPDGFGVRLTPENVDRHLARIRAAREVYARTHPEEVSSVERKVEQTETARQRRCRMLRERADGRV
ncbi:MAG: hypothetical protein ACYTDY_12015, partial [Planctomycetota bacterium]